MQLFELSICPSAHSALHSIQVKTFDNTNREFFSNSIAFPCLPCLTYGFKQMDFLSSHHGFEFFLAFLLAHSAPSALRSSAYNAFKLPECTHVHTIVLFISLGL